MSKINISFIQYGGLAYGGAQKQAISLAKILDKNKFTVRYFWSVPAKDLYSDLIHPTTNLQYLGELKESGVEPVEFKVRARDISHPYHPWQQTDFFEVFKKYPADIIFSVRAGHPEFPFVHLNLPIVEWNVFGQADASQNLVTSVAVSPWVQKEFLKNGGKQEISKICFPAINSQTETEDLRGELNIKPEEIILGFHQRVDDGIFGSHTLEAFAKIKNHTQKPLRFFILGGSEKYKELAKDLHLKVEFLPLAMDYSRVSKFLNTLDIFCHSAGLGESVGLAVMEAMMHGLPVVSIKSWNNGHIDVIGSTNKVSESVDEYAQNLLKLIEDEQFRKSVAQASQVRAKENFSFEHMNRFFENIFQDTFEKYGAGKKPFQVLPQDIYNHFSFYRFAYRMLARYPKVFKKLLPLNRRIKDLIK